MLDATILNKISELIEKATSKRNTELDATIMKQLKLLCKASDENVRFTFDLLMDQMKAQHAQVRLIPVSLNIVVTWCLLISWFTIHFVVASFWLQTRIHAVAVCDELFSRSRIFRSAMAADFLAFLELAVGFKPTRPLPGPPEVATRLREKALEICDAWNEKFGIFYQQACNAP
jgi:hypothetical protein